MSPYLDQVLSLPEDERPAWMESFRAQRPDLADLVQELLQEHQAAVQERFLERSPIRDGSDSSLTGQKIGAYTLISPIGEGGMGTVWLAERSDGRFERRVAIKFLNFSVAAAGGAERFKREGRILGQLAHPHIAELIDAGVSGNGEPYLVLENVDGEHIDEYCDRHKLDVDARVKLFLDVLAAVDHAHANLIVHRDIKPSNVLVRNDGQVKLLDFGIAKLLADDTNSCATTVLTIEGSGALTPLFAAPEQISGGTVTTATDVYGLGVLLYLLLSGQHPAGFGSHSPAELVKAIVETEPLPASEASALADGKELAGKRATTLEKLRHQLRGDLDTIIARALKKAPAERYASVSAFADDLRRYVKHEPIRARPDTFAYRTRKFARRNHVPLATACAFALVLIVAAVVIIRQSIRANREAAVAEAVNDFLQNDLLAQASASKQSGPSAKPDPDLKVRTALDRAAERIEGKFSRQPEVEAAIRNTIGQTYTDLGLYPEASKQLERALNLRLRVLGPEHPDTLKSMSNLALVYVDEGKYAQGEALHSQTLDILRRVLGREHPDTLKSMNRLAVVYDREGKYAQAEALLSQTLEIQRRVLGREHPDTLNSINRLANEYYREGKYAQAEALLSQTLEIRRRVLGPEHPDTLSSMMILGSVYDREGKYAQAETLGSQTLEIQRRVIGPDHLDTLSSMNNLASVYDDEGKYAQAEALHSRTLEIRRRVVGPDHPDTLLSMMNLANAYDQEGKYTQAEALHSQTLEIQRRVLGPEHPDTLLSMMNLANVYDHEGKYAQAEALHRQTLEIRRRVLGPEHPDTLDSINALAEVYEEEGKHVLAESYASQALAGRRHAQGSEDPDTMAAAADLALAYVSQRKFAETEVLAREVVEVDQKIQPDDWQQFRAESLLGAGLAGEKKYAEAESLLLKGYQGMLARKDRIAIPDRHHLERAHHWLVQLYKDWGKPEKAAKMAQELER